MQLTPPIYTWESYKGNLHLSSSNNDYELWYETNEHQRFQVLKHNIKEICYENSTADIQEFCQNYFFKEQILNDEAVVTFFESDLLDNYELNDKYSKGSSFGITFNALARKKTVKSNNGPSYTRWGAGLNFEGVCVNLDCKAKNSDKILIPVGFGEFDIAQMISQLKCPSCEKKVPLNKIKNLGFSNCTITIQGCKLSDEEQQEVTHVQEKEKAERREYKTYAVGDNCHWTFLKVTASKPARSWCNLI